jgi:hypothetical protein|tara:strand:- start:206 stop:373 length:168 start_codon:yes stop_codon:yes gene_type:complete
MMMPSNRTGINTIGLAGCVVLAGVVFNSLNPWWLIASALCILSGIGLENNSNNKK